MLGRPHRQLRAERDALAQLQTAMDVAGMRQGAGEASSNFGAIKLLHINNVKKLKQAAESSATEYDQSRPRGGAADRSIRRS